METINAFFQTRQKRPLPEGHSWAHSTVCKLVGVGKICSDEMLARGEWPAHIVNRTNGGQIRRRYRPSVVLEWIAARETAGTSR